MFLGALTGVLFGCRLYEYNISAARKFGAPLAFAILCTIPIPVAILDIVAPLVVLYIILMDNNYERSKVNRVFGTAFLFSFAAILVVYSLLGAGTPLA